MIVGWKIEWEGWIMWSAICFPKEFIYFGERSSIFPSNSKRGPGPGGEAFLERKKSHILWMDIFFPSASSLPSLGEGGRAGRPPRSSWWAGYKGNVSQTSKCRNLPWSSSPNAGEKSTPVRPVGSTKGDVELAWGALAAREAGGLPIHPPQFSELGWSSSGPGTLRNWDLRRSYTRPALTELNVRLTPTETLVQRWVGKKNMHSRIFPVRALWWGRMLGIQSKQVWFRGRMHGRLPGGGDVYTATQRTEKDLAWSSQKVLSRWIKSV